MANMGQNTSTILEPVSPANLQNAAQKTEAALVVNTTLEKDTEREQEMITLKEELAAQETLRESERE